MDVEKRGGSKELLQVNQLATNSSDLRNNSMTCEHVHWSILLSSSASLPEVGQASLESHSSDFGRQGCYEEQPLVVPTGTADCWTLSKSVPGVFFYQCVNNISVLPKLQAFHLGLCLFLNLYWLPWCWGALDVLLVLLLLLDSCGTLSVFYVWTLPLFGFSRPHMFRNWWPESIMVI